MHGETGYRGMANSGRKKKLGVCLRLQRDAPSISFVHHLLLVGFTCKQLRRASTVEVLPPWLGIPLHSIACQSRCDVNQLGAISCLSSTALASHGTPVMLANVNA